LGLIFAESLSTGFERLFKRLSFVLFPLVLFYPGARIIKNTDLIIRLFAICTFIYIVYCFANALHHSLTVQNHKWIFNSHPVEYDYENTNSKHNFRFDKFKKINTPMSYELEVSYDFQDITRFYPSKYYTDFKKD